MHLLGRALSLVGLIAEAGFIAWHIGWGTPADSRVLGALLVVVELGFLVGSAALVWVLWPDTRMPQRVSDPTPFGDRIEERSDVIVRIEAQPVEHLRATLRSLAAVDGVGAVTVVDLAGRSDLVDICFENAAELHAAPATDGGGIAAAISCASTRALLLLDAGDVVAADALVRLQRAMNADDIAAVQSIVMTTGEDSHERHANGSHELDAERNSINPGLGWRGCGFVSESGALLRRRAFIDVDVSGHHREAAQWRASVHAFAQGWRIIGLQGEPAVARPASMRQDTWNADRTIRALAARQLLLSTDGVLRHRQLSLRQRMAMLAWSVRPLSGMRRTLFAAVVIITLLSGWIPLTSSGVPIATLWLPGFLYTSLGMAILSRWSMRPGDRARLSLRSIGAAWRSFAVPPPASRAPITNDRPIFGHHGALVLMVLLLAAVIVVRGISQQFTGALAEIPDVALGGLLLCSVWMLGMSLDALQLLARRGHVRVAARVASSMAGDVDGHPVFIADITPFGAGLTTSAPLLLGQDVTLRVNIPTSSGCTTATVPARVRNLRADGGPSRRVGIEFVSTDHSAADALAEFCVVQPALRALGSPDVWAAPERHVHAEGGRLGPQERRTPMRLVALGALTGAALCAAPVSAASPSTSVEVAGSVRWTDSVDDTSAPPTSDDTRPDDTRPEDTAVQIEDAASVEIESLEVAAVCSTNPGDDGSYGTIDDTYTEPVVVATDAEGDFVMELTGEACWMTAAPPAGWSLDGASSETDAIVDVSSEGTLTPLVIDMATGTVPTVELAVVSVAATGGPEAPDARGAPGAAVSIESALRRQRGLVEPSGVGVGVGVGSPAEPQAAPATGSTRLLASPAAWETAPRASLVGRDTPIALGVVVMGASAALALSVMAGLTRPRHLRDA